MKEYFQHDYHARSDENILRLIRSAGWEGYGLYWALVEMIYEGGGSVSTDYDLLAYELRTEPEKVKTVCENYDLFYANDGRTRSASVDRRLEERATKSAKTSASALSRWGKCERNTNALRSQSESRGIREENKREEKKREDDSISEGSASFETFWQAYPKKTGKGQAWTAWQEKGPDLQECLRALEWQAQLPQWVQENGRFIPNPAKWLKDERWMDECPAVSQAAAAGVDAVKELGLYYLSRYEPIFDKTATEENRRAYCEMNRSILNNLLAAAGSLEIAQKALDLYASHKKGKPWRLAYVKDTWAEFVGLAQAEGGG